MYLIHNILGQNNLYNILTDGQLKPSSKTGNIKGYGLTGGSKYIYLRLDKKNDIGNLYFNSELLLNCVFYLNVGWHGEITTNTIKIDGKKLDKIQLNLLLTDFNKKVNNYYNNFGKKNKIPIMMSNEIMVKKNIPLKKFLVKIKNIEINEKTKELIKQNYENVKLF